MPQPSRTRNVEAIDDAEGPPEFTSVFRRSLAIIIGINEYANGIPRLQTPVNDADHLAALLEREHEFVIQTKLTTDVTRAKLVTLFSETLPALNLDKHDRLLVYFAGHGISMQGADGEPQYFLIPQDARASDTSSFLPMREVREWLLQLDCRHLLLVLDCCFAGGFGRMRALDNPPPVIYRQRYNFYCRSAAWQVIASAAHDETALDTAGGFVFGRRYSGDTPNNSPFALAFMDALHGDADTNPPTHPGEPNGDGLVTVTEVLSFVRDRVQAQADEISHRQTPALWSLLPKHQAGEYFFGNPQRALQLQDAPALTADTNPYRGLKPYEQEQRDLFFGRGKQIQQLRELVAQHSFLAVLGASGTGKSSLVKAGLVPTLSNAYVMRPTNEPLPALEKLLGEKFPECKSHAANFAQDENALAACVAAWREKYPGQRLLLVIDQFEELVTLCDESERKQFQTLLANALRAHADCLCVILTLRTDFEPSFANGPLQAFWRAEDARYIVPPMTQDDLRQVIVGPALKREVYFESAALVETLINEVIQTPGGLPLLSFTLSEMYLQYLQSGRQDRTLSQQEYQNVGGVIGSLRNAANKVYAGLADDQHRSMMQRVMLRMVAIEGGEVARRRVATVELDYGAQENPMRQNVVDTLTNARLVVNGGEGSTTWTEPAHDALITGWDRLMEWKVRAAPYLPLQRELAHDALRWQAADAKSKTALLWNNDPRLSQLQDTLWRTNGKASPNHAPSQKTHANQRGILHPVRQLLVPRTDTPSDPQWLNQPEVAFVQSSVKRRSRVFQRIIGITAAVIVVLSILTFIAVLNANEANRQTQIADNQKQTAEANAIVANQAKETAQAERQRAEDSLTVSRSRELAAVAVSQFQNDPEWALLISVTANEITRTLESENILRQALQRAPITLRGHRFTWRSYFSTAIFSPDSVRFVTTECEMVDNKCQGTARIWETNTGKELVTLRGHTDIINSALFSPDGSKIVTASRDKTAKLWDGNTGQELATLRGHTDLVFTAEFSPDSRKLVTASRDMTAKVWDANTGKELGELRGHAAGVWNAQFSPDGKNFLTVGVDNTSKVWDAATFQELVQLQSGESQLGDALFSPDGSIIATANNYWAMLFDANTGKKLAELQSDRGTLTSIFFSPDGNWLLTMSTSGTATVWNVSDSLEAGTGKIFATLPGHTSSGTFAAFSPDGTRIVTASQDGTAKVWNLSNAGDTGSGTELYTLRGHTSSVDEAAFSPDGRKIVTLASNNIDHIVRIWDAAPFKEVAAFQYPRPLSVFEIGENYVRRAAFSPDGSKVVTVSKWDGAKIWDASTGKELATLDGHSGAVNSTSFSPNSAQIVTASSDKTAKLWDAATGKEIATLQEQEDELQSAIFSPDASKIAIVGCAEYGNSHCIRSTVKVWDALLKQELVTLQGHRGYVLTTMFSPNGSKLVTVGCDIVKEDKCVVGSAKVWDATSGNELATLGGHSMQLLDAVFSPDGSKLVTVGCDMVKEDKCIDGSAKVWEVTSGKALVTLQGHTNWVNHANFSKDGSRIVTASDDSTARVWDVNTGNVMLTLQHTHPVHSSTFSPDGLKIATASCDANELGSTGACMLATGKIWDAMTGKELANLPGHTDDVTSATFSPDGSKILTTSDDGTARMYVADIQNAIALARARVPYPPECAELAPYTKDVCPTPTPSPTPSPTP